MRYDLTQKALETAADEQRRRLDAMNEFRATLTDQAARMPTRIEMDAMIVAVRSSLMADLKPLMAKVDMIGQTNWPLLGSFMTIGISVLAAVWLIIGLKIDAVSSPTRIAIESNRLEIEDIKNAALVQLRARLFPVEVASVASSQADNISRNDRFQLNERLRTVEGVAAVSASDIRSQAAANDAKLVQIETQFKSLSDARNTAADVEQQMQSILYEAVFPGRKLPPRNFRPEPFKK